MVTQGSETSQYLQEKKSTDNSLSSGERKGNSPNLCYVRGIQILIRVAMMDEMNSQAVARVA